MKQKITSVLLAAILWLSGASVWALSQVDGVYQISSAADLLEFKAIVEGGQYGASALLTADIDMAGQGWASIGQGDTESTHYYTGSFDGGSHTISNLGAPLFFRTGSGLIVKDLTLAGTLTAPTDNNEAAFIGYFRGENFTLTNLTSKTDITLEGTNNVAGILGYCYITGMGTLTNCVNEGTITAAQNVGGIIGQHGYSSADMHIKFFSCANKGNINASGDHTGGIIGYNQSRTDYTDTYNTGNITSTAAQVGGITGQAVRGWQYFIRCHNTGAISGASQVGGIFGDYYRAGSLAYTTLIECYNEGAVTATGDNVGGLIGRANVNTSSPFEITRCYNTGTVTGTLAFRPYALFGWTNSKVSITDCWNVGQLMSLDDPLPAGSNTLTFKGSPTRSYDLTNTELLPTFGRPEGYEDEWLTDGRFCFILNGQSVKNAKWFQTIGTDQHPVLDPTHGLVFQKEDESIASATDDITELQQALFAQMRKYAEDVVAYQGAIDTMLLSIDSLTLVTERNAFISGYYAQLAIVQQSEKTYQKYANTMAEILTTATESHVSGTAMDILLNYLNEYTEPNTDLPNGSSLYVIDSKSLSDAQIEQEILFAQGLLDIAIRTGYKPGDEITKLLVNADLSESPNFTGWDYEKQGSTFTTGGVKSIMTTAEAWNATFDMHQTLTGLANGVYELRVNAAFRPAANIYNTNVAAFVYANDNAANVITESEDVIYEADAQDSINCYITAGASNTDYEYINDETGELGYVPYGPLSCSFAFNGGRYENIIVANVTDGNLTVGLRLPGTGCAQDWMGFGNFRLYYQGEANEPTALEALQRTLDKLAARAQTQINYQSDSGAEYKSHPQFSQALRDSLQAEIDAIPSATTGEQRLQLIQRFTQTFQSIYSCKKAYVTMFDEIEDLYDRVYSLAEVYPGILVPAEEMEDALSSTIIPKWEDGLYSEEEAASMAELRSLSIYAYLDQALPKQVDGVYQLSKPQDIKWLAAQSIIGDPINACLTADIDMSGEPDYVGGTSYCGTLDGQGHTISGLKAPLFELTNDGTVIRRLIVEGEITEPDKEQNVGAIIANHQGTNLTLDSCINRVTIFAPDANNVGGLIGRIHANNGTNGTLNARITNCVNEASVTGRNFVGGIAGIQGNYTADLSLVFQSCANKGDVTARVSKAGGLLGIAWGRTHTFDSYNTGNITSEGAESSTTLFNTQGFAGGLIGAATRGLEHFERSYNTGKVTGLEVAGGLFGGQNYTSSWLYYLEVVDCWNVGEVQASKYAGGLVGICTSSNSSTEGTFTRCFNEGHVSGSQAAAFAAQLVKAPNCLSCYNAGEITTDSLGAVFVAKVTGNTAKFQNCWNSGEVSGIWDALTLCHKADGTTLSAANTYDLANTAVTPTYGRPDGYEDEWLTNGHFTHFINTVAKDTIFFQTLGEDLHPVLNKTHRAVILEPNGQYTNGGDGIAQPMANSQQPTAIYDLSGRRVAKPTRGLYIIGGRKVFVK